MKKPFIRWAAFPGAGLFSNTGDIAVLMQTMLNGGGYGDVQLFSAETVKMFTTSSKEDATFGLGWRVNGNATMTPTFGTLASPQTYGHTGWTGTVTVIDPVNHMAIVMLSNQATFAGCRSAKESQYVQRSAADCNVWLGS